MFLFKKCFILSLNACSCQTVFVIGLWKLPAGAICKIEAGSAEAEVSSRIKVSLLLDVSVTVKQCDS